MTKFRGMALLPLLVAGLLQATSHCYKERSNCFVEKDGKDEVKMYIKRDKFTKAAKKQGLSKERIEEMIRKGEGYEGIRQGEDLRDERGYYGGVYWPHPIYVYPPYYWDDRPHHPGENPPSQHPPGERPPGQKPPKSPVTIQPTENPFFDRPNRPERPSTQPVQRPVTKPAPKPYRPVTKPTRPMRPAVRPTPRPRSIRRAR